MDNSLYAMLFAEDLIDYCMAESNLFLPSAVGVRRHRRAIKKQRFTKMIGSVVTSIMCEKCESIKNSYENLLKKNIHGKDDFRYEISITIIHIFPYGYKHVTFLNLCALLGGLSCLYAMKGNFEIADASAQVLAYLLNFFNFSNTFDPRNSWFELSCTAQYIRRIFNQQEARREETMPVN